MVSAHLLWPWAQQVLGSGQVWAPLGPAGSCLELAPAEQGLQAAFKDKGQIEDLPAPSLLIQAELLFLELSIQGLREILIN